MGIALEHAYLEALFHNVGAWGEGLQTLALHLFSIGRGHRLVGPLCGDLSLVNIYKDQQCFSKFIIMDLCLDKSFLYSSASKV